MNNKGKEPLDESDEIRKSIPYSSKINYNADTDDTSNASNTNKSQPMCNNDMAAQLQQLQQLQQLIANPFLNLFSAQQYIQQMLSQIPQPNKEESTGETSKKRKRESDEVFIPNKKIKKSTETAKSISTQSLYDTIISKRSGSRVSYKCSPNHESLKFRDNIKSFKDIDRDDITGTSKSRVDELDSLIKKVRNHESFRHKVELNNINVHVRMCVTKYFSDTTKISERTYPMMCKELRELVKVYEAFVKVADIEDVVSKEIEEGFIENVKERITYIFNLSLQV